MNFENKKIGIWGFGVVGKSMLRFLADKNCGIEVFDSRSLQELELQEIKDNSAQLSTSLGEFLESSDYLIVSPGIDTRNCAKYSKKFISELDVFYAFFKKPIIALTGSVGKTTSVNIISQLMSHKGLKNGLGGNVGYAMCDLIQDQDRFDYAVLELSSFQLDQAEFFVPHIAVWTNFYDNHLDRHGTADNYFAAKFKLLKNQTSGQIAIVNYDLMDQIYTLSPKSRIIFFTDRSVSDFSTLRDGDSLFFVSDGVLRKASNGVLFFDDASDIALDATSNSGVPSVRHFCEMADVSRDIPITDFPSSGFLINHIMCYVVLYSLGVKLSKEDINIDIKLPAHRVEKFLVHNNIEFYNDSKSTVSQATLAAVDAFTGRSIILILGGVGKGVDRGPLIKSLVGKVKLILIFGAEAQILKNHCDNSLIESIMCEDLDDIVKNIVINAIAGDVVLFSPAGASFDMFKNYEDRGNRFKEAINAGFLCSAKNKI